LHSASICAIEELGSRVLRQGPFAGKSSIPGRARDFVADDWFEPPVFLTYQQDDAGVQKILHDWKLECGRNSSSKRWCVDADTGLLCKAEIDPNFLRADYPTLLLNNPDSTDPPPTLHVVVPVALRDSVVRTHPGLPVVGHAGRNKVINLIARQSYWKSLSRDIARWIKCCSLSSSKTCGKDSLHDDSVSFPQSLSC
jgi:hypothetical protein